jgi:hypothetical protein
VVAQQQFQIQQVEQDHKETMVAQAVQVLAVVAAVLAAVEVAVQELLHLLVELVVLA